VHTQNHATLTVWSFTSSKTIFRTYRLFSIPDTQIRLPAVTFLPVCSPSSPLCRPNWRGLIIDICNASRPSASSDAAPVTPSPTSGVAPATPSAWSAAAPMTPAVASAVASTPQPFTTVGDTPTPGAQDPAVAEITTGAKPATASRADTTSVAAGCKFVGVTTAGDHAVFLFVRLNAAAARGDVVQQPATFVSTLEAAIGAVLESRRIIAAHAADVTARTASTSSEGAVRHPREAIRAAQDLTVLRGVARAQKASLDAAFVAAERLLERADVNSVVHRQAARRSSRRGELHKTV